ncbi:hypothetical protein ABT124_43865 [Streptomyces sp. NPDC001982]|uniref:hypothetical protein n=1 Tax=unclassified Streptomyces TaxID=2593676 RepID=UPI00332332BA
MTSTATDPERYHLTMSTAGRPAMHGWWPKEATARGKFRDWIGAYSKMPDAHVTLAEQTGAGEQLLESWPSDS